MNTKKSLVASPILLLVASPVLAILIVGPLSSRAKADNTDIAHAWMDAWNSHNPDTVAALYTEDAVLEDVTLGVVNRGRAAIRDWLM
jgi:hypothetical protein